jgi:hypothetical protein
MFGAAKWSASGKNDKGSPRPSAASQPMFSRSNPMAA